MNDTKNKYVEKAIELSHQSIKTGSGGPFGAVIVKDGKIIAEANNDPSAHAEIQAIRKACKIMQSPELEGCQIYVSAEPCPMCLGAIYWAGIEKVYYANSKEDSAKVGFKDKSIYEELERDKRHRKIPTEQTMQAEAFKVFQEWQDKQQQ